jgi:indole-3-glycerol phosphate synthase
VAESGIRTRGDIERLEDAGYRGFLIGESLLSAPDPGAKLASFLE